MMLLSTVCFLVLGCSLTHQTRVRTSLGELKGSILRSRDGRPYAAFTRIPFAKPPVGELRFQLMMLLSTVCFLVLGCSLTHQTRVRTSLGELKGSILRSRDGRPYAAFTRIPFAKPPVGELRFQEPMPVEPWTGFLDATKGSPKCPQSPNGRLVGQEDCLYLEIFTPNIFASLPVLVYIHSGSYLVGPEVFESGKDIADFFMDEDVVFVTLRYRLGILGFLSLENTEMPGNQGLKDMALALEWLYKEVQNFGGNPNMMSTFGISAGGASTHYLCLAPRTRKLLKGCISESGVAGALRFLNKKGDAKAEAVKAARSFNCPEDQIVSCLRNRTINEIILPYQETVGGAYKPSIEPESRNAIITEWPPKTENTVFPWIVGHTENEGLLISDYLKYFENETAIRPYTENWETYFPELLRLKNDTKEKARRVHDRFFLQEDPYVAIEQFITESMFVYPALKEALRHEGPKYFYLFNYTGGPSLWEMETNMDLNTTGVSHCAEAPYFFDTPVFKPKGWPSPKDIHLSKNLVRSWVNFAKTQNPEVRRELPWKQFERKQYLDISNKEIQMKEYKKLDEIISFWDSIFE